MQSVCEASPRLIFFVVILHKCVNSTFDLSHALPWCLVSEECGPTNSLYSRAILYKYICEQAGATMCPLHAYVAYGGTFWLEVGSVLSYACIYFADVLVVLL